jgi:hypothetical protein
MKTTDPIELDTPIERGESKITHVTLRKPNAGELRGLSIQSIAEQDVNTMIKLLPRISEPKLAEQEVAAMDPADLTQLGIEVGAFLLPKSMQI